MLNQSRSGVKFKRNINPIKFKNLNPKSIHGSLKIFEPILIGSG